LFVLNTVLLSKL